MLLITPTQHLTQLFFVAMWTCSVSRLRVWEARISNKVVQTSCNLPMALKASSPLLFVPLDRRAPENNDRVGYGAETQFIRLQV